MLLMIELVSATYRDSLINCSTNWQQ